MKLIQFEVNRKTGEIRADADSMDIEGAFAVMAQVADKITRGELVVPGVSEWISCTDVVE